MIELATLLKKEMEQELDNILDFWAEKVRDKQNGGFVGFMSNDLIVDLSAPKGLVLHARILWTFARAYRVKKKAKYLEIALEAKNILEEQFLDQEHDGYYWQLDEKGNPLQTRKQIYGHAFVLYAYSEYVLATGDKDELPNIRRLVDLVERSFDPIHNGYFEAYTREWQLEDDLRLSSVDLNEKKSMNTHLHILEAYTTAYLAWPSEIMKLKLQNLIEIMINNIVDHETGHLNLFFAEDWRVKSNAISFGHDIEASWLLYEAATTLGIRKLIDKARTVALQLVDSVLKYGVDLDGALWNESDANKNIVDTNKDWWPQAEAVVGFINAWEMTGKQTYWDAGVKVWDFIKNNMIDDGDQGYREWFWAVNEQGVPISDRPKVSEWKCPYHNARASFEIIERL